MRNSKDRIADQLAFSGRVGEAGNCQHERFVARVDVGRLAEVEVEGGPITGYSAEIQVKCDACGLAFRFIGVPAGNHYAEPRVSSDGLELRAPLEPATHHKFQTVASYVMPPRAKN